MSMSMRSPSPSTITFRSLGIEEPLPLLHCREYAVSHKLSFRTVTYKSKDKESITIKHKSSQLRKREVSLRVAIGLIIHSTWNRRSFHFFHEHDIFLKSMQLQLQPVSITTSRQTGRTSSELRYLLYFELIRQPSKDQKIKRMCLGETKQPTPT